MADQRRFCLQPRLPGVACYGYSARMIRGRNKTAEADYDARMRAFADALHDQLANITDDSERYRYLLALCALLGGYLSETEQQHRAAMDAIPMVRNMFTGPETSTERRPAPKVRR